MMNAPTALPDPGTSRWQLLRAGIQNIWEYDDQRFVFQRGRLLLRGQNESGKTKALEVLLPFLFDADLQPQRLDPFGSTARPMRWNLLNDSNPDVSVAIGYVWLELGRIEEGTPRFCTVGAGLRAKRSVPGVENWYFVSSQRVDVDLRLYDANRVPLTRAALGDALAGRGQLFDRASDYRRAVNGLLFGMPNEQYSALIDALLQLRRPQLSKQLDPEELSRILSASLPPLDTGVVGTLAEGFERLDRHRAEREELAGTLSGLRAFLDVYRGYVASFVKSRALDLTRAESAYHASRAAVREVEERQQLTARRQLELAETLVQLQREGDALEERIRTLRESDEFRAVRDLDEAVSRAQGDRQFSIKLRAAAASARDRAEATGRKVQEAETASASASVEAERSRVAARDRAAQALLDPVDLALAATLERGDFGGAHGTLATAVRMREEAVASVAAHARRISEATSRLDRAADRFAAADDRARSEAEKLAHAESEEAAARDRFLQDVSAWSEGLRVLSVDAAALLDVPPAQMRGGIEAAATSARHELDGEVSAAALALSNVDQELEDVRRDRDALLASAHQPPPAPSWRAGRPAERPGAPFYLVCEFRDGLAAGAQAGLEAALEASGLLDAWVTPEGRLLDPSTSDVVLAPAPQQGATLADVLRPAQGAAVPEETIAAALRSVGLVQDGTASEQACWVSTDGRFRLGPLHGSNGKDSPAFIGASAREEARLRRIADLDARIAILETDRTERQRALQAAEARRELLADELQRFPDHSALLERQAATAARAEELAAARTCRAEAAQLFEEQKAALREEVVARDAEAARLELRGWVDRLDELRARTAEYDRAARDLISSARRMQDARALLVERQQARGEAQTRLAEAESEAEQANGAAARAEARAAALREAVGSTRDEMLGAIRSAEERRAAVRGELEDDRKEKTDVDQQVGALRRELDDAQQKVADQDGQRREADARFREVAVHGLLALAGVEGTTDPAQWSFTDALLTARRADEAMPKIDPSQQGRDRAWNKVGEKHGDLMRSVRPEIRVVAEQISGLMLYRATFNARGMALLELRAELEAEVASRDRLLGEEEQKLFESFLTGEAHEHLRARLRDAFALVKRMNRQLEAHPTSSGMQMRLGWEVAEETPPGTREVVALLLRSGHLLSDADRSALSAFLRQRLDDARRQEGARPLQEQMMAVLDYRAWHTFHVECRSGPEGWKRLTRKVHAAGSGGQKAVMLHLPLFAAAAAFYESASAAAPRLILLDEAFAGIDRETRGQLMGLLAEFDLDFVMTSFEEWGFYPQLDGLSTYHLAREKGMRGVYADWFVWNGREAIPVGAA